MGKTTKSPVTTKSPPVTCVDKNDNCRHWMERGECKRNPTYMSRSCTKSCGLCEAGKCLDENKYCSAWKDAGYCGGIYEAYMTKRCPKSCGKCGTAYKGFEKLWGA